jgi:exopolysaccharide biosynthesis protein
MMLCPSGVLQQGACGFTNGDGSLVYPKEVGLMRHHAAALAINQNCMKVSDDDYTDRDSNCTR